MQKKEALLCGEPVYKMVFASRGMERLRVPMQLLQDEFYFCIQDAGERQIITTAISSIERLTKERPFAAFVRT